MYSCIRCQRPLAIPEHATGDTVCTCAGCGMAMSVELLQYFTTSRLVTCPTCGGNGKILQEGPKDALCLDSHPIQPAQ